MTAPADIWTPHLQPGEQLVWSADASEILLAATRRRTRLNAGLSGLAAAVLAIFLALRFFESLAGYATADIGASLLVPLYGAFALAMAVLTFTALRRLNTRPPAATRFAVTSLRLIALSPGGDIADQILGADIEGVIAGGRPQTPDLYVLRKGDDNEKRVFAIEHVERPLEAKAIIEETYLEPAP